MTALEKRNRLHQRKGLWLLSGAHHHHHNDTVGKPLPRAVVPHRLVWKRDSKLQKPLLVVAGVAANGGGGNNIPRMIRIDATTLAMIQLEVQELLRNDQQQQQQCTVLTLANALAGSRNVIDVYAECATTMEDLESVAHPKLVSRSFRDRVLFRRKPKMDPVTNRKYAIVNALNRLQETPKSSTTPVTSWEDAMEALSKVMHFPEDDAGADENATAARNEHTSKTKGDSVDDFVHRMRQMRLQDATLPGLRDSQRQWLEIATYAAEPVRVTPQLEEEEAEKEKGRLQEQEREREAQERASDLLRPLKPDERQRIFDAMDESAGPDDEVICTTDTDSIQRASLRTLRPHEWLNDEVIHYFLVMLSKRDEQLDRPKRTHFFKSFFMTKLRNEGNADPALDGVYCYANVKRWSKKVTGKNECECLRLSAIFARHVLS